MRQHFCRAAKLWCPWVVLPQECLSQHNGWGWGFAVSRAAACRAAIRLPGGEHAGHGQLQVCLVCITNLGWGLQHAAFSTERAL